MPRKQNVNTCNLYVIKTKSKHQVLDETEIIKCVTINKELQDLGLYLNSLRF